MTAHARPMRLLTLLILALIALAPGDRPAIAQAPPPAPTGLIALTQYDAYAPYYGHYVNLVWTAPTAAPACSVERSTGGGPYQVVSDATAYISPGASSGYGDYDDAGLPPSTTYSYRVRAHTGAGGAAQYSAYSNVVTVTTLGNPPPVPTNLTAVTTPAVDGAVSLSWSPSAGATYYQVDIFAGDGTTGYYYCDPPAGGGQVNVTLTGLTDGDQYAFDVAAVNNPSMQGQGVLSAFAGPVTATPQRAAPAAPIDLSAYATGSGRVALYWTPVPGAAGYNVYRGTAAGGEDYAHPVNGATPVNAPSYPGSTMDLFTDTGVTSGTEYFYTIEAVSGGGTSIPSNEDSDTSDPSDIPWDTRNPSAVLSAFRNVFSTDEPYLPNLRVVGPDGTIYDDSYGTAQPPDGSLDPSTNQATLANGDIVTFEEESYGLFQASSSASAAPIAGGYVSPLTAQGITLNPANGPYRRVQTVANLRGVQGDITLPMSVTVNDPATETPYIYLGLVDVSDKQTVDAGLQYRDGAWQAFMRINGQFLAPGVNRPAGTGKELINVPTTGIRFLGGDTLTLRYYAYRSEQQPGSKPYKASLLVADGTLLGNNDEIRSIGGATKIHQKFLPNVQMKRVQALAQEGAVVTATGSSFTIPLWNNGMLLQRNDQLELWGRPQVAVVQSGPNKGQYDDGSYDGGGKANVTWTPSIVTPYSREDNTAISIFP